MKYWGITYGKIIEGIVIIPTINLTWALFWETDKLPGNNKRFYDVQFAWLWWYFTIGQIHNRLKELQNRPR